jgi:hypothetical protein
MEVYNINNLISEFDLKLQSLKDQFNIDLQEKENYNKVYNDFYNKFLGCLHTSNGKGTLHEIIIAALTQMGKTQMVIDTIKNAKPDTISVVVLDNKTPRLLM